MLLRRVFFVCTFTLIHVFFPQTIFAYNEFKTNNPDVGKYTFARSYISALSYLNVINLRWGKKPVKKVYATDDIVVMRGYVIFLIKDKNQQKEVKIDKSHKYGTYTINFVLTARSHLSP